MRAIGKAVPVVCVLGIDGSGKSTVSRTLAQELSASRCTCLIGDDLSLYRQSRPLRIRPPLKERLRRLIAVRAKQARSLKLYKIPKMADLFLRDYLIRDAARYAPDLIVTDGSPLLNMVAWAALYHGDCDDGSLAKAITVLAGDDDEIPLDDPVFSKLPELRWIKRLRLNHLRSPDIVVVLDLDAEEAVRRIAARSDQQQVHEEVASLDRLRKAYLKISAIVREARRIPVLTLNASEAPEAVNRRALDFVQQSIPSGNGTS